MADKRAYAKFDIGYLDNPKMLPVLDESHTAVIMHAVSVLYAAQHLTDGHVPVGAMIRKVGGSREDADLLIANDLWHGPGHECDECPQPTGKNVYVHNYLEHNRSEAEANALAEAGAKGARKRWANAKANSQPIGEGSGEPNANPNSQRERKKERNNTPASDDASETAFGIWWSGYPKKVDKGQARKAFKAALKKAALDELVNGAQHYANHIKAQGVEKRYIKNPSTWLNAESWANDTTHTPPPKSYIWD